MRRASFWATLITTLLAPGLALAAEEHGFSWFQLLGVKALPHYMLAAIVVAVLIVIMSILTVGRKSPEELLIPDEKLTLRNVLEIIVAFVLSLAEGMMGEQAKKYMSLFATIFIYILFMNLLGLIPGFLPPTDKMNITVGCALVVFFATHYYGVAEHGLSYFKHFMGPVWWMAPLMVPIEIISHLARPMSLSLRLFGNITGDHLVVGIFLGLVPFVVPSIFYGLGVFVSFMQAFIFAVLSIIYIAGAVEHEEEH
ncbi:MAG: ATP synthase F0 subunit A [Deltaproteobacteria bacterium]|nr:MAG: ATP synthase F0 subunit A [Deltaproteobacteria bacterium]